MKERCSSCKYFELGDGDTGVGLCRASVPEVQYVSIDPKKCSPSSMVIARWPVVFAEADWCGRVRLLAQERCAHEGASMTKLRVVAKYWIDSGQWEFYDLTSDIGQDFLKRGRATLIDLPAELLEEYKAALARVSVASQKIQELVDEAEVVGRG